MRQGLDGDGAERPGLKTGMYLGITKQEGLARPGYATRLCLACLPQIYAWGYTGHVHLVPIGFQSLLAP